VDLEILVTLQNVTGTMIHKVYNTSTLRCSLYELDEQACTQSPLFSLVLGLGFYFSVGFSSISSFLFCTLLLVSSLDLSWLHADWI
jgi:hypothetical protein